MSPVLEEGLVPTMGGDISKELIREFCENKNLSMYCGHFGPDARGP